MTTKTEGLEDDKPKEDTPKPDDDEDSDDDEEDNLVFRVFTADSWEAQLLKEKELKEKEEANKLNQGEAHLVDGELQFESEEHHGPQKHRTPGLVEGNTLREGSGFPKELYGKPIDEIDKLITDKTFCVIAERFKKEYINRFSSTNSFFLLPPWNPLRKAVVYVATNQYFDYFIILTILSNCVFLAMPDEPAADTSEYVFLGIYTIEMIIKLLARGFIINSFTYLRDAWNWLDFIVILSAYFTIILEFGGSGSGLGNLQGIRTFRVFRILRTVSIVPGLKTIVNALLRAFKMLFEVMMLILFCLMVFALFALQIYMGVLRQKCVVNIPAYNSTPAYSYAQYYNDFTKNSSNWYDVDGEYRICGNTSGSQTCPDGYSCLTDIGENPNFGYTGFDHFGWAMLTSFQLMTLDFWEDSYNKVLQASGPVNVIFFVIVVFFGSFYLLNLLLAVVAMSYEQEAESAGKEKEKEAKTKLKNLKKKKKQKKKEKAENEELKDLAHGTNAAVKAAVEMALPHQHTTTLHTNSTTRPLGNPNHKSQDTKDRPHIQRKPMIKMPSKDSGTGNSVESSRSNGSKDGDYLITDDGSYNSTVEMTKKDGLPTKKTFVQQASSGMMNDVSSSGVMLSQNKGFSENNVDFDQSIDETGSEKDEENAEKKNGRGQNYVADHYPGLVIIDVEDNFDKTPDGEQLMNRNCLCCYNCCGGLCFVPWLRIQSDFFLLATEPLFDLFITASIMLNTIFMALDHDKMSDELVLTQDIANYIFTGIFTIEAIVKIIAFTKHYFKSGWNIFDLVIVVASLLDLGLENVNGLSVLRTFRLLRVLKLAQSWPTMRLLLSIIMNTLGALANLTGILCIVIYIFAVIGLQLFNKSYTEDKFDGEVPRWHFNDIFHSFMMVFRVLCGEWIEPLWDCMRAANELCMVVFLPTLVLGYFVILNLFLALLLNAFASDTLRDAKVNEEDNRLALAFTRLKHLCCCCFVKKTPRVNSVGPDGEDVELGSVEEIGEKNKDDKPMIGNGTHTDSDKHANGVITNGTSKNSKGVDNAFNTKRDQYSDFNKAMANSKQPKTNQVTPDVINDSEAKDDDKANLPEETEKDEKKPGVRIFKIPLPPKPKKKNKKDSMNQVAAVNLNKKDTDELELGAEASTIKKEKKEDEEEEEEKIIEVRDCFPLWMTTRLKKKNWMRCCYSMEGTSLGEKWFSFRVFMNRIVEHRIFEAIVLFMIAFSSLTLAFEDVNLYANQGLVDTLYYLNLIFTGLFCLEMFLKWFAFGFTKYFTDFWCLLDFAIVAISLASLIADAYGAGGFSAFRSLRTLRALRPLRAISRWQSMRIVVNALMMAIPSIVNVLMVILVFWLIFSIMGVQFMAGKFYKCVDADGNKLLPSVTKDKTECLAKNYTWKNSNINFDNVLQGYLALFQVATFEGWMEVMEDAIDSTEVDQQPSYESNLYMYLYFVGFIVFGSFFTLNLLIGVIIDNFNALKKKYDGNYLDMFLTAGQRKYYNTIKKLGNKKPKKTIKRPKCGIKWLNTIQGVFYDISCSSKFELCIVIMIFLNMISMAVEHYQQTETVTDILNMLNILFVVIFALEAIVKIVGLRWHYFRQPWNVFDFIVVILSLLGVILDDTLSSVFSPTLLRVVRVFRIGRVLRLIKAAKGIRKLLFALIISLPALFNIGMLLCLIMYIYSIICLSTFQNLKITGVLDEDVVNFKTFINSFLLMFRLSTSAGWNDILETLLIQAPDCSPDNYTRTDGVIVMSSPGDCGTPWLAVIALTSYIIIIFLVVINMFIAVILENFNQAHEQEEVGITDDDFDMFYAIWERYDPLATQFIKYEQLSNFVADLEPPLGIPKPNEIALVSFDLPITEGDKLHCLDVLMALVKYVLGNVEESPEFRQLHEQMEVRFQDAFPTRVNTSKKSTTMTRKKEDVAAKTLQRAWRSWKAQKQMKNIAALALQQQNQQKKGGSQVEARAGKTSSIRSLGMRLSTALSAFFSTSRPSSAISRLSVKSMSSPSTSSNLNVKKRKGKAQSAIEVPKVSILYSPEKDADIEL